MAANESMDEMDRLELAEDRIAAALEFAMNWSQFDGGHHKAWAIDQMVRILAGCTRLKTDDYDDNSLEYAEFINERRGAIEAGEYEYGWDVGIPP